MTAIKSRALSTQCTRPPSCDRVYFSLLSMQKKLLLFLSLALFIIHNSSFITRAVHADEATDNLKKRLQESLASPAPTPISLSRGYIGIVKDVIKDTVIMQDKDGKKDLKLQDDTTILRTPGNVIIKPENIRIDDAIIAIGYPVGDAVLTARRLILSVDPIKPPAKDSGLGTISKIGKNTFTLQVNGKEQILDLTAKTIFKSAVGAIELTDLAIGDTLVYTATLDANDAPTATLVMRIKTTSASPTP